RTLIVNMKDKADAAFGKPEVYEYLVPRDIVCAIGLLVNEVLQYCIRHLLRQPVGRPPKSLSFGRVVCGKERPHAKT
ncbi:MAG: hypothetical protein Q7R39_19160, partial [Dehalococcoidia bacterium]|nr:hypothetical protein [Dehalococcoidia bacterium]